MKSPGWRREWLGMLAVGALVFVLSCAGEHRESTAVFPVDRIKSVAVLPFAVVRPPQGETIARCPFGGATYLAGRISENAARELDLRLRNELVGDPRMIFVSGTWAEKIREDIRLEGRLSKAMLRRFLDEIYRYTHADAVLMGDIYAFQDKKGTAYGVESPAYVAFDLFLIDLHSGRILWRNSFSQRQKDLSQNILDLGEFFAAGGRWLTAVELAELGLKKVMKTFPLREPARGGRP